MREKKVWIVQHELKTRTKERLEDGEYRFKTSINETEHISEGIADQAARNVATQFKPTFEEEDDFDRMIHKKDQVVRVIRRTIIDDVRMEYKYDD